MTRLSDNMQQRLEKWKKNILPVLSTEIFKSRPPKNLSRSKGGDADTKEMWDEEFKRSQNRK